MKTTQKLIVELEDEVYRSRFVELYGEDKADSKTRRCIDAIRSYEKYYGETEVQVFSAPGRTEIGGNHTDHQHGEVLAASIDRDILAVAGLAEDRMFRVYSEEYGLVELDPRQLYMVPEECGTTAALVRGVLKGFVDRGLKVDGVNIYTISDVPGGSGMSSSAAFETVIGNVLSHMFNLGSVPAKEIAIIGQFAENVYFDKPCGLMDQIACSVGGLIHIDFADPSDPIIENVELDQDELDYVICVTDTKGSHADLTPDYAAIPQEMHSVATYFERPTLRGVTLQDLLLNVEEIREQCGDRAFLRALHCVQENRRVREESWALREKRFDDFLDLYKRSGASSYEYLQNIYPSGATEHQSLAIALAIGETVLRDSGICRVHGGGFAGTVQAFVRKDAVERYRMAMDNLFGNGACIVTNIRREGGCRVL